MKTMVLSLAKKLSCKRHYSCKQSTIQQNSSKYDIQGELEKERQKLLSCIPGGHDYDWLVHELFRGDPPEVENEWDIDYDDVIDERKVKQERKSKRKSMLLLLMMMFLWMCR